MEGNAQMGRVGCSLCRFSFLNAQHFDAHDCPAGKGTICTCGKTFVNGVDFVAHFGSQHVSGNQCLVCMETIEDASEKDGHWLSHGEDCNLERKMIAIPQPAAGTATVTENLSSDQQRQLDLMFGQRASTSDGRGENHAAAQQLAPQRRFMDDGPSTSWQNQMPSSSKERSEVISCKRPRLEEPQGQQIPPSPQCHTQPGPSTRQTVPPHSFLVQQPMTSQQQQQSLSYRGGPSPPFQPMYNSPSYPMPQGTMQYPQQPQYQVMSPQATTPFHPSVKQYLTQLRGAPNANVQYPQLQQMLQQMPQQMFSPQQQQGMLQAAALSPMNHPQFAGFDRESGLPIIDPRIPLTHPHRFQQQQQPPPQPARSTSRRIGRPRNVPQTNFLPPQQQQGLPAPFPNPFTHLVNQQQGTPQQVLVPPPHYPGMHTPQIPQQPVMQNPPPVPPHRTRSVPTPPPQVVHLPPTAGPPSFPAPIPTAAFVPPPAASPIIHPRPTILETLIFTDPPETVPIGVVMQPTEPADAAAAVESPEEMPHLTPEAPCDSLEAPSTSTMQSFTLQVDAVAVAASHEPPTAALVDPLLSEDPIEEAAMDVPTAVQPAAAHPADVVDAASSHSPATADPEATEASHATPQPPAVATPKPQEPPRGENLPEKLACIKEEVANDVTLHHGEASKLISALSRCLQSPADLASLGASEAASIDDLFKRYELLKRQAAGAVETKEDVSGPSTSAAEVAKEPSSEVLSSSNTVSVATGADEPTEDVKDLKEDDKTGVTLVDYPPYKENRDAVNDELEDGEIRDDGTATSTSASDSLRPPSPSQADPPAEEPKSAKNSEDDEEPEQPEQSAETAVVPTASTEEEVIFVKAVAPRIHVAKSSPLKPVKMEVVEEEPHVPAAEPVQPVPQPVVDEEPVVVRTPSRTPSRTPARTTRNKTVKRESVADEDFDEYTPSTSTRPVGRRSVKKEWREECDVKPSAYDLVKSSSRSCRIKEEPMDDDDLKHQRFLRCDSSTQNCPECGDAVGRLSIGRRQHYKRVHYPILFRLEKGMSDIERWVSCRLGAFTGLPATEKDGRICLVCNEVNELFNGRMSLIKHIQQTHKAEYKQLKEDYRLYSREKQRKPEDLDVHRKLL